MKEQMKIIQAEQETNENTIKKLKEDLEKVCNSPFLLGVFAILSSFSPLLLPLRVLVVRTWPLSLFRLAPLVSQGTYHSLHTSSARLARHDAAALLVHSRRRLARRRMTNLQLSTWYPPPPSFDPPFPFRPPPAPPCAPQQLKQANNSLKWERGLVKNHARELAKMRSTSNAGAISRVSSLRLLPTMLTHVCRPTISSGFGVAQAVQTDEGKAESIALHERVRVDEATQTTMVRHVVAV